MRSIRNYKLRIARVASRRTDRQSVLRRLPRFAFCSSIIHEGPLSLLSFSASFMRLVNRPRSRLVAAPRSTHAPLPCLAFYTAPDRSHFFLVAAVPIPSTCFCGNLPPPPCSDLFIRVRHPFSSPLVHPISNTALFLPVRSGLSRLAAALAGLVEKYRSLTEILPGLK